jgi:SNW domain-containing protein 1
MRLQADGRNLQDTTINKRFGSFAESLYTAERNSRKEIQDRNKIQKTLQMMGTKNLEENLQKAATLARAEK